MGGFTGIVIVGLVGGIVLLSILFYFVPFGLWISALAADARVSIATLIGMRLRKVPPHAIVIPRITAVKAGLPDVTVELLEAHYLAGGHVDNVGVAVGAAGCEDGPAGRDAQQHASRRRRPIPRAEHTARVDDYGVESA